MHRREIDGLDARCAHWAVAVEAPVRDWIAAPGCRAHARFLVDDQAKGPSTTHFARFDSRAECLQWMMAHRQVLTDSMPGATARPVLLANWLLGLA